MQLLPNKLALLLRSSRISIKNKKYVSIGGIIDFFNVQFVEETVNYKILLAPGLILAPFQ